MNVQYHQGQVVCKKKEIQFFDKLAHEGGSEGQSGIVVSDGKYGSRQMIFEQETVI